MQPEIPPEVLYDIVAYLVAEYLDQLVPSQAAVRRRLNSNHGTRQIEVDTDIEDPVSVDSGLIENNPVMPLLQVSYRIRETTLVVLSDVFGIPRDADGWLTSKPWTHIMILRQVYGTPGDDTATEVAASLSPLLKCYRELANLEAMVKLLYKHLTGQPLLNRINYIWDTIRDLPSQITQDPLRMYINKRCADLLVFFMASNHLPFHSTVPTAYLREILRSITKLHREALACGDDAIKREHARGQRDFWARFLYSQIYRAELLDHVLAMAYLVGSSTFGAHRLESAVELIDISSTEVGLTVIAEHRGDLGAAFERCREHASAILKQWPPESWKCIIRGDIQGAEDHYQKLEEPMEEILSKWTSIDLKQ